MIQNWCHLYLISHDPTKCMYIEALMYIEVLRDP